MPSRPTASRDRRSTLDEVVERRREELAEGKREGVREYLGELPPDEERHIVLERFYGSGGGTSGAGMIRGTGASPGCGGDCAGGSGPDDFGRVRSGDVLIAATTTPAWTPLLPSLGALVTETGGILSHAAIVAREYGLPAVVGAAGAMSAIPDGARVRVDGLTGDVEIIRESR